MPLIILLATVILLTAAVMVFFRAPSEKEKTIAENDDNELFRAYGSFMGETY